MNIWKKLKDIFIPETIGVRGMDIIQFKDQNGKVINHEDYEKFVIRGDSLELCNIHDKDIAFVNKLTLHEYSTLELPAICIFYRGDKHKEYTNNKAKYLTGQVFARLNTKDNVLDIVNEILNHPKFQRYKTDIRYSSDSYLKKELENIPDNINNISLYTHLDENNSWVLEWIDSLLVFGEIKQAFTFNDDEYIVIEENSGTE